MNLFVVVSILRGAQFAWSRWHRTRVWELWFPFHIRKKMVSSYFIIPLIILGSLIQQHCSSTIYHWSGMTITHAILDQIFFRDPVALESICCRTRAKRLINEGNTTGGLRKIWTGFSMGYIEQVVLKKILSVPYVKTRYVQWHRPQEACRFPGKLDFLLWMYGNICGTTHHNKPTKLL